MLKKLLLPVAALTAMTFVACNESTAASEEPASSTSVISDENIPTENPADNPSGVPSSSSESVSSSSAKDNAPNQSNIPEGASRATCEIKDNAGDVFQMTINVIDSAVIDINVSNTDIFSYTMDVTLDESMPEAEVREACIEMQEDNEENEGLTVSCDGRKITIGLEYEEPQTAAYAMMIQTLVESCKDIQEKGYLEDDEDDEYDEDDDFEEVFKCDVDMNSDHWTVSSKSFNGDYTFSGNTMTVKETYSVDYGIEASCLSLLDDYNSMSEDYEFTCEGSTMVGKLSYTDEQANKKDYYDQIIEQCSSN